MDVLSRTDLAELAEVRAERCVSMFVPAHRAGPDSRPVAPEDVIRWKNVLRQADGELRRMGASKQEADALLEPARGLIDDPVFWRYQGDGLAAFSARGYFRTFRLPLRVDELVVVAPQLHLTPLLPLLVGDGRFRILALSQNEVRVIDASRDTADEVKVETVPSSLDEALQYDDPEKQLQFHTATPRRPGGGRRSAAFHGHGVGTDDTKDNVLRFCQQVDRGLAATLREAPSPLILAAVESVAAIYRQANTYPHLLDPIVAGNPEGSSARELRDKAWPLVEPHLRRTRDAALARCHDGRTECTQDLATAVRAAADGRVDVLFVPIGVQRWGRFEDATREVALHERPEPGDVDLLNAAALRTVLTGGTVYPIAPEAMPDRSEVTALLRY